MDCYKEFAHIYDELINSDIDYETWANVILDICNKKNIEKRDYLDLACGTGNITERIGKKFINTWAVDMSYDMLTEAETKLRGKGIRGKYVCQNICELNLNKKFDLITCCLDSTNYITEDEDIERYFSNVANHLKDGGVFIFDINSYYKLSQVMGNNIYNYDSEDVVYVWENCFEDDIVDMYLTFFVKEGDLYRRFNEVHRERAYTEKFIEDVILKNNLKIISKLNDYEEKKIDSKCERIAYVLGKC